MHRAAEALAYLFADVLANADGGEVGVVALGGFGDEVFGVDSGQVIEITTIGYCWNLRQKLF